jgi:hypothetical protein
VEAAALDVYAENGGRYRLSPRITHKRALHGLDAFADGKELLHL